MVWVGRIWSLVSINTDYYWWQIITWFFCYGVDISQGPRALPNKMPPAGQFKTSYAIWNQFLWEFRHTKPNIATQWFHRWTPHNHIVTENDRQDNYLIIYSYAYNTFHFGTGKYNCYDLRLYKLHLSRYAAKLIANSAVSIWNFLQSCAVIFKTNISFCNLYFYLYLLGKYRIQRDQNL